MPDRARVVFVLLLIQAGTILLAMLGELLFMGGLFFYALMPLARVAMNVVFGVLAMRGHRGALICLIVLEGLSLLGFLLSAVVGLLPQLDFTPNLTGLFTSGILPIVVIVYCAQLLSLRRTAVPAS
ncbi:MAG TPA: hypothetical protein DGG94_11915 [Micromonosporaceae bacterium]|nr:hypothetical protein [Micromonosporaceae bacterium]HCU50486.1 hypothetical protein [Micromonosporaceae bacterium]